MGVKYIGNGVYLPEREEYLVADILKSPKFGGLGTVQFKKFQRAFGSFKQFRSAIDIGANVGLWTRTMARCFERVDCFEPNPECHEAFWANNESVKGQCLISLHTVALGEIAGKTRLNNKLRSTGFTRVDAKHGDLDIEIRTLDSYGFTNVDFIKIDVEGFEYYVVRGGIKTITENKPVIIVEQKPENAERFGVKQLKAVSLLEKWGAYTVDVVSGDYIMSWR